VLTDDSQSGLFSQYCTQVIVVQFDTLFSLIDNGISAKRCKASCSLLKPPFASSINGPGENYLQLERTDSRHQHGITS
jgi:hypothetical protein